MPVLDQSVARGDVIIRLGATTTWAVRWTRSVDGQAPAPVPLDGYGATLELRSPYGDLWLSQSCRIYYRDGIAEVTIRPADVPRSEWGSRTSGSWLINAFTLGGQVTRLADGYFYLEA